MFDEQPDGDPHGECAAEIHNLTELVRWAYGKLHHINFTRQEDALRLDEMKLLLEHGGPPEPEGFHVCPRHDFDIVTDPKAGCPKCNAEKEARGAKSSQTERADRRLERAQQPTDARFRSATDGSAPTPPYGTIADRAAAGKDAGWWGGDGGPADCTCGGSGACSQCSTGGVDSSREPEHVATIQPDRYGGASVHWITKPHDLPPGTKLYAHAAGVKTCNCERAMVPAGEQCKRCGGAGTYGVLGTRTDQPKGGA